MGNEETARLIEAYNQLAMRVESLERQLADQLRGEHGAQRSPASRSGGSTDRRGLLRGLGVAAGAAIVGTVASATPAAATDGEALIVGDVNTSGPDGTLVAHDSTVPPQEGAVFRAQDHGGVEPTQPNASLAGWATGTTFVGVHGRSDAELGQGVRGESSSTSGSGVVGYSDGEFGAGVRAISVGDGGIGVDAMGAAANLWLRPGGFSPHARTSPGNVGMVVVDDTGDLWVCVGEDLSGTWRRLTGPATTGGLTLLPAPVRIYDSRPGFAPLGVQKGRLSTGSQRTIDFSVIGEHLEASAAVVVNVTVTDTSASGFLKLWSDGPTPASSLINWFQIGSTVANGATVALANGTCQVRCGGAGASTDFIVDIAGYYA